MDSTGVSAQKTTREDYGKCDLCGVKEVLAPIAYCHNDPDVGLKGNACAWCLWRMEERYKKNHGHIVNLEQMTEVEESRQLKQGGLVKYKAEKEAATYWNVNKRGIGRRK